MKTVPLTVRRCPKEIHQALKQSAKANHRSLNGETLVWLERGMESKKVVTCAELADALEAASKILSLRERRQIAAHIERARNKMSHEHLR